MTGSLQGVWGSHGLGVALLHHGAKMSNVLLLALSKLSPASCQTFKTFLNVMHYSFKHSNEP